MVYVLLFCAVVSFCLCVLSSLFLFATYILWGDGLCADPPSSGIVTSLTTPKMYGCESWTVKKAKRWKIYAFELWCWRKLLRVPWTARRSNQSILKQISPRCSLEGLMLKLKLQYFGHLMWRVDSLEKTMMLGGIEGRGEGGDREWEGWMASPTQWTWVWVNSGSWWWTGRPGVLRFMRSQRVRYDWETELTDWLNLQNNLGMPSVLYLCYSFFPLILIKQSLSLFFSTVLQSFPRLALPFSIWVCGSPNYTVVEIILNVCMWLSRG